MPRLHRRRRERDDAHPAARLLPDEEAIGHIEGEVRVPAHELRAPARVAEDDHHGLRHRESDRTRRRGVIDDREDGRACFPKCVAKMTARLLEAERARQNDEILAVSHGIIVKRGLRGPQPARGLSKSRENSDSLQRYVDPIERIYQRLEEINDRLKRYIDLLEQINDRLERYEDRLEEMSDPSERNLDRLKEINHPLERYDDLTKRRSPRRERRRKALRAEKAIRLRPDEKTRPSVPFSESRTVAHGSKEATMARRKRDSKLLPALQNRIAGLKSIHEKLDLGSGVSVASLTRTHHALSVALANYNKLLSDVDGALNEIVALEGEARDLIERTLAGVATKFGKDSSEYEQAGGTRKSERKKRGTGPVAKAKARAAEHARPSQPPQAEA